MINRSRILQVFTVLILTTTHFLCHSKTLILNDIDWPPYLFPSNNKAQLGIGKEILNRCLTNIDYQIIYTKLPIKRTHKFMQSGILDISIYSYKKEREEFLVYAKVPIFISEYGFAVRADSNIEINSLDDLSPYTIGHLAGLSHTPELINIINKKRALGLVTEGQTIDSMFAQLLSSMPRIDIMPNTKDTFYWRAKTLGVSDKIKVLDYTITTKSYFITVSKNSKNIDDIEGFLAEMNTCITQMHNNGQYDEIISRYGRPR
ncbi:MAG: ABC-type amino acid transport substrate-binding protein [Paraglaciecola sp.]|jgi:ABC-type amino acid transport substrate-binding protein